MNKIKFCLIILSLFFVFNGTNAQNVSNNKTFSNLKEYEVIIVYHERTKRILFTDTLTNDRIIYTEKKVNNYAFENIPNNFLDISEKYIVSNKYFNKGEKTHEDKYIIYFDCFMGHPESSFSQWKYIDYKY